MRHWYVTSQSNPAPFENLQYECQQIALYVRNHVLEGFCMDSPNTFIISSLEKVGPLVDSETQLSFEDARRQLGIGRPANAPAPAPVPMVTEPGTTRLPIHQSVAEAATLRRGADSEGSGALASPITADSEGRSRENEAKKARSEPKAIAVKAESKSWPPVQGHAAFRGAGFTPQVSPPLLIEPKSYEVSSSRAAGAKAENYDEVFGPADAAASELNPGPLTLPSLPPLPCLALPPMLPVVTEMSAAREAEAPAPAQEITPALVTDLGTSQTLPARAAPMSPVSPASTEPPDYGGTDVEDHMAAVPVSVIEDHMVAVPVSGILRAHTPTKEDQDHELRHMSSTQHVLEQAAAYLTAIGIHSGHVTPTDLGDVIPQLCEAVAHCSGIPTPVWTPPQTPSQSRAASPRSYPGDSAGDEIEQKEVLISGMRKLSDGSMVLEPSWYLARGMVWLLRVRTQLQDDSSFLNARGPH